MNAYLGVKDTSGNILRDVTDSNGLPVTIGKISRVLAFSTTTLLAANAVYTSPTVDAINYKVAFLSLLSDVAGSYIRQNSDDGIKWVSESSATVTANAFTSTGAAAISRRYFRIIYTNGAAAQAAFDMSCYLAPL